MTDQIKSIQLLFQDFKGKSPDTIDKIPQSGSDRVYYKIIDETNIYIATYSLNIKENKAFIYFSNHFQKNSFNTPQILRVNDDFTCYLQTFVGSESLLEKLETIGYTEEVFEFYKQSLKQLAALQIKGDIGFDYNECITAKEFGKQAILNDLLYFKYYFLDPLQYPYDKQQLIVDFENVANFLNDTEYKYLMFRDFQSRNIMLKNNNVNFIDYQGGMKGALQYDIASLLWQAKAQLSTTWKKDLFEFYIQEVETLIEKKVDKNVFTNRYNGYVLIRLLQVLGAYGFRGLFERKAHFLSSIPLGLNNLKQFLNNEEIGIETPELDNILSFITSDKIIKKFTATQATLSTKLKISINSFSYKKGLPLDETANGGGFVFDMRGILNPGRKEEYKKLTGKDKSVIDYLEQQTEMNRYLNSVWDLIDINVEDYLNRDFENLQINFGCTGGQHRSVYAAEQTARHLRNKYKLNVELTHLNTNNWPQ